MLKNLPTKFNVALLCTAVATIIFSCRKDISGLFKEEVPKEIAWAQSYYKDVLLPKEGNLVNSEVYAKSTMGAGNVSSSKKNLKTPIWQLASSNKNKRYTFVETPFKYTTKVTPMFYVRNDGDTYLKNADQRVLMASLDRLIIYKNKKGVINQRIVTYIPTKEYLNRHKGDISHNKIDKLDKDFEGFLVYREWNGTFLFALVIKEGMAVKKFSLNNKLQYRKTVFREQKCDIIELYEWFQDCSYRADDPVPFDCGEPYQEYVGTYEYCYEDGEGPGDPCLDPANFGTAECGGGEDPWEMQPPETAKDSLKKIMKDTCLNEQQINALAQTLSDYLNGQGDADLACVQKAIYNKLLAAGEKFGFCIDSNISGNGSYNPGTGNFFWKDESGIPVVGLFGHEIFHGYQDTYYSGGTAQYNTGTQNGFPNIEFEQALFYDIVSGSGSATAMGTNAEPLLVAEYQAWINNITNNNTTYPKQFSDFGGQYYYFLDKFYQNANGYMGIGQVNNNLPPNALLNIFSSSNCK